MAKKVLKKDITSFVKNQLGTNKTWACTALIRIFDRQTEDEKSSGHTHDYNNIGFTGVDAEILTSFAMQYLKKNFLSPKQMAIVYKKMPKYHRQIIELSDQSKLATMVANA